MNTKNLLFIMLIFVSSFSFSQEKMLLNSGKEIEVKGVQIEDSAKVILYKNKHDKVKYVEMSEVFSWTREDGVVVIFYKPQCKDVCFKTEQMHNYLQGIADGKHGEKGYISFGIGFAMGGASGFLIPPVYALIVPALTATGIGIVKPKEEKLKIPKKYEGNMHYMEGFKKSVRKKRVIRSIFGGLSGVIVGAVTVLILAENAD